MFGRVWVSASYNAETGRITPPGESVGFEYLPEVGTSADLIGSICLREEVDAEEAQRIVASDVREILDALASEGRYVIEDLGELSRTPSGEIAFGCSADFIGASATCWLPNPEFKLLAAPAAAPAPVEKAQEALRESRSRAVAGRGVRIAATWGTAVAVFAAIVLVTGWINGLGTGKNATMASAIPTAAPAEVRMVQADREAPLMLVFRTPADGVDEARVRPERTRGSEAQAAADGPYCLIVASLANMDEANVFVEHHSTDALPLSVVPMQGRIRVSAMSGTDAAALSAAGRNAGVYDVFPNAWVCRR